MNRSFFAAQKCLQTDYVLSGLVQIEMKIIRHPAISTYLKNFGGFLYSCIPLFHLDNFRIINDIYDLIRCDLNKR